MEEYYYFDTSSILDLYAYGLVKRLRKVNAIIVPEVLDEILDRNLKRRLQKISPYARRKRAAFVLGLVPFGAGERGVIRTMSCDSNRRLCIYVSNDAATRDFINRHRKHLCEGTMDTSEFIIKLYKYDIVGEGDIQNILSNKKRRPNQECRKNLEQMLQRNTNNDP